MSVLRKAKDKAKQGMRVVNAERKKHFRTNATSGRPPGNGTASSAHTTSFNFRQMNDAFEAVLDDDTDLFSPQTDQPKSSGQSNLFESMDDEHVSRYSHNDDLFGDNLEHVEPSTASGDLFSDNLEHVESSTASGDLYSDVEDISNGTFDPLSGQMIQPPSQSHSDEPSEMASQSYPDEPPQIVPPSESEPPADVPHEDLLVDEEPTNFETVQTAESTHTLHNNEGQLAEEQVDDEEISQGIETKQSDNLFDDSTPELEGTHHDREFDQSEVAANPQTNISQSEIKEPVVELQEIDDLFTDDHTTGERHESVIPDSSKQDHQLPTLAIPSHPESISPNFSPLSSSLASSYEEDHYLGDHSRGFSPGRLSEKRNTEHRKEENRSNVGSPHFKSEDTESDTVAELEAMLAPKSKITDEPPPLHPLEVSTADRFDVPSLAGRSDGSHLDSGVFDHDSLVSSHHKEFDVQEDYFGQKGTKETSYKSSESRFKHSEKPSFKPQAPRYPISPHTTPPKKNSAGKIPPQRPSMSPKMRRKLHSGATSSVGKYIPPHESTSSKNERLAADDLFEDDLVVVPHPKLQSVSPEDRLTEHTIESKNQTIAESDRVETGSKTEPSFTRQGSTSSEEPYLTLPYHLLLSVLLYLYYSLNSWSYLAGLFAGFLLVYLMVGTVFVFYVQTIEKERKEKKRTEKHFVRPSDDFLRKMNTDFDKVKQYHSTQFTATLKYDPTTHHPRQRLKAEVRLHDDFKLTIKITSESPNTPPHRSYQDMRQCTVTIVPEEVAANRKRRWSKKFPICITQKSNKFKIFLFPPTSREKEDWFRRLRHASDGFTSDKLIEDLNKFFGYMQDYFPTSSRQTHQSMHRGHPVGGASSARKHVTKTGNRIQYSSHKEIEESLEEEEKMEVISITRETGPRVSRHSRIQTGPPTHSGSETSVDRSSNRHASVSSTASKSSLEDSGFESVSLPPRVTTDTLWLNAVAARLCWDIWHDKRWKDWVMSRIQKKLIRVKTPSFLEQLRLTDVELGNDMPVVNRLCGGPRLDLRGIWIYLDVTYEGCFVMTIKTKLKSGAKEKEEDQGRQMNVIKSKEESGLPSHHPHTKHPTKSSMSHSSAARALAMGTSVDPYDNEIDSGCSDDEDSSVLRQSIEDELSKQDEASEKDELTTSSKREKLKSVVMKFGKQVGKKVANTKFVRRAVEKASSIPLEMTVVVNRLDGVLAINIPPPTTDTIWFGFTEDPKLELVAKPKLGHREVKLSAVTQWIEKKLCEVVNKKLVLPEMEDIVIPVLNSGLPEDKQKSLISDNEQTT